MNALGAALLTFFFSFLQVTLLAINSLNVVQKRYAEAFATSLLIGLVGAAAIYGVISRFGLLGVAAYAMGGAAGCVTGMFLHGALIERGAAAQHLFYWFKRSILATIANVWQLAFSLPEVSGKLMPALLVQAAKKQTVFTDYDDTLAPYQQQLSPAMATALVAVMRMGRRVVVVSDRPPQCERDPNSGLLHSLLSIPAADRSGLILASANNGQVYQYDLQGEARLIFEMPPSHGFSADLLTAAVADLKSHLADQGVRLHDGSNGIPSENMSAFAYALMLKVGTPEALVLEAAARFSAILERHGLHMLVQARLAKHPLNPPYVSLRLLDKSLLVAEISRLFGIRSKEALILGDSMYTPNVLGISGWLGFFLPVARWLAMKINSRPVRKTENGTDRDIERALPGALTFSVGGTADPRMKNAFVLPVRHGEGPEITRQIFESLANQPLAQSSQTRSLPTLAPEKVPA